MMTTPTAQTSNRASARPCFPPSKTRAPWRARQQIYARTPRAGRKTTAHNDLPLFLPTETCPETGIFLVVVSVAQIVVTKIVLQAIFYTKDNISKTFKVKEEWKYDCREMEDFNKYICFYAEGNNAAGIIAVGQISFSFIGVGQVCFPILLGCGQVVVTSGFALAAQVAVANISGIAMIAVSSMIGFFNNGWIAAFMKDVPMYGNFCGCKQN